MSRLPGISKRVHSKKTSRKIPKGAIPLDADTRAIIQKEAQFLSLQPEEYCKLVMICAQVLRETSVQTPLSDSSMLRSIIGSPLLLSMVRAFATNYLSSALSDVLSSQKQQPTGQPLSQVYPQQSPYPSHLPPYALPSIPEQNVLQRNQQSRPLNSENSLPWTFF